MRVLLLVSFFFASTNAARILCVVFRNSRSHLGSMLPLAQALSKHGHDVTMYVETRKDLGELSDGVKNKYIMLTYEEGDDHTTFNNMVWSHEFVPEDLVSPFTMGADALTEAVEQDEFWQVVNGTWDFIITDEVFTPTGYGLGMLHKQRSGTPHAVFSTTDTLQAFTTMLSLNRHPTNSPSFFTKHDPFSWHTKYFMDRVWSMRQVFVEYLIIGGVTERVSRCAIDLLGYSGFTWKNYYKDISMVFNDFPDRIAWPITQATDMIYTGSFCRGSKPLPDDLERFVSDPTSKGTIYFAFGSVVQWDYAPKRAMNAFVAAVNNMTDYRVIWSFKGKALDVKSHVKLMEWAPQNDLLNHPRTKLFISHGGLKSVKEAICSETPVVYLPFFGEQAKSALFAKELGFAEYLNKMTFDAPEMVEKMSKVLKNDQYHSNVVKLKSLFVDRIMDQLEEGVFWTEKVIRYGERPVFFKRFGMQLSWTQFFNLDAFALLFCAFFLVGGK